ncbi:TlpA family protein disulfide reductase [Pyxidicoccus sp. 3LFB2]
MRRQVEGAKARGLKALVLSVALLAATTAGAVPRPGEQLPEFTTRDLLDRPHKSRELVGRPTLLVVITDKDGGDEMQKWFDTAKTRVPEAVHRASILTLKLPFFVSAGTVRGKVREKVPRVFWGDTWLDKNGAMGKALGLATSRTPYAFVLDARGRVVAAVHGTADAREAQAVWDALTRG